jgi:hypothetical protein
VVSMTRGGARDLHVVPPCKHHSTPPPPPACVKWQPYATQSPTTLLLMLLLHNSWCMQHVLKVPLMPQSPG